MVQKAQPYKYQVYNEIKRGILKGQYVSGDVLTERRLSEEMGISRTPIREAMQFGKCRNLSKDGPSGFGHPLGSQNRTVAAK